MKMKVLVFPRALRVAEAGALSELNLAPSSSSERYFFSNDQRTARRAQSAPRCARTAQHRFAPPQAVREPGRGRAGVAVTGRGGGGSPGRCRGAGAAERVRRREGEGERRLPGRDRARGLPPRDVGKRRALQTPRLRRGARLGRGRGVCNLSAARAAGVLEGAGWGGGGVVLFIFSSGPLAHIALPPPASFPYLPKTRCPPGAFTLTSPRGRRRSHSPSLSLSLPLPHTSLTHHLSPTGRDSG